MKNKILVEIIIPRFDDKYNLFIPANKRIGNIIILINKAIIELSNNQYKCSDTAILYNRVTGEKYEPNSFVNETNIRNGTILVLDWN